jgi:hypothetical protein
MMCMCEGKRGVHTGVQTMIDEFVGNGRGLVRDLRHLVYALLDGAGQASLRQILLKLVVVQHLIVR